MSPLAWTLGIDPGVSGALAILDDEGDLMGVEDMPVVSKASGRREVDAANLARAIRGLAPEWPFPCRVVLEQVGAMPGQGVASMFAFGDSFGVVRGALAAMGAPVVRVTPQVWKRSAGLIGADKDLARAKVIERFPDRAEWFARKKDVGRADAVLLALYGFTNREN